MNYPRLLSALTLSTLLPACTGVDWNLSRCVYELPEHCTGLDLEKPVGGVAWVPRGQEAKESPTAFVLQVPEVTYTPSTRPVLYGEWASMERLHANGLKPTGRLHWVKLAYGVNHKAELLPAPPEGYVRRADVPRLPTAYNGTGADDNPMGVEHLSSSRGTWGPVAALAAAPLYPLDCALVLASNIVTEAAALAVFPFMMVGQSVSETVDDARAGEKILLKTAPGVDSLPEDEDIKELLLRE